MCPAAQNRDRSSGDRLEGRRPMCRCLGRLCPEVVTLVDMMLWSARGFNFGMDGVAIVGL
jgi:hypothetical protein